MLKPQNELINNKVNILRRVKHLQMKLSLPLLRGHFVRKYLDDYLKKQGCESEAFQNSDDVMFCQFRNLKRNYKNLA